MNIHHQIKAALTGVAFFLLATTSCSESSSLQIQNFPELSSYASTPSTNFLVDLAGVSRTSPFVGSNNANYHDGAHVHFGNDGEIEDGSDPSAYPAIYAIADGTITSIDDYQAVGENYKYDIELSFAKEDNQVVKFQYSIEPMINPGLSEAYKPFILVTEGQTVSAGEIIAYMLVPDGMGDGSHIHFNIYNSKYGSKQAPAIFSLEIMTEFFSKLEEDRNCMGIDLTADENPWGTGPVSCL